VPQVSTVCVKLMALHVSALQRLGLYAVL
jgi:hypothetical protein